MLLNQKWFDLILLRNSLRRETDDFCAANKKFWEAATSVRVRTVGHVSRDGTKGYGYGTPRESRDCVNL
eukprot:7074356-Prymnesium_polylepis.1